MSRSSKQLVERLSDRKVCDFLHKGAKIIGAPSFSFSIAGGASPIVVNVESSPEDERDHEEYNAVLRNEGYLIQTATVSVERFTVNFTRNAADSGVADYDSISIQNDQRVGQPVEKLVSNNSVIELDGLISQTFHAEGPSSGALYKNPAIFKEVMRSHQRMIERLQEATVAVGAETAAARAKLEQEYWSKNSNLLKDMEKKKAEAEREINEIRLKLAEEKRSIDDIRREIDDRNNTHARRALHANLKARIAEHSSKFELTADTVGRRRPIHTTVILTASLLAMLLIYTSIGLAGVFASSASPTAVIIAAVKPLGVTVALLGLMSWYLRWMNRWFERHADAEFSLKQFELDIDRASWVVETALEWKFEQKNQIPDHLLESISRNLFSKSEKDETADMHPADYLASALLGRASGLRLKVPGGEIEYGKNQLKGLQADKLES